MAALGITHGNYATGMPNGEENPKADFTRVSVFLARQQVQFIQADLPDLGLNGLHWRQRHEAKDLVRILFWEGK
jgi:hypothetical protein